LELERVVSHAKENSVIVLRRQAAGYPSVVRSAAALNQLVAAIVEFSAKVRRGSLSEDVEAALRAALRATRSLRDVVDTAVEMAVKEPVAHPPAVASEVAAFLRLCDEAAVMSPAWNTKPKGDLKKESRSVREHLLHKMSEGSLEPSAGMEVLDEIERAYQVARQMIGATRALSELRRLGGMVTTDDTILAADPESDEL
jgi:hypothetical protein